VKQTIEIDDSTTVSGLPAPFGWVCLYTRRDEDGIYGRAWERTTGQAIRVVESLYTRPEDGYTWLHVSVSKPNRKLPTWEDVQVMRACFVGEHRESYMIFPTQDRYVNIHPGVLHLYCCLDQPEGVLPRMEGVIGGITSI
jgi:hypothetical protein